MPSNALDPSGLIQSIQHSPIATIVTDFTRPDNPIIAVNAPFCLLTGFSTADVIGRNCRFLAGRGTEPVRSRALGEAVSSGQPALVELTNYRKDGSEFGNAVMIAPVRDEAGAVRFFIGSQMEIGAPEALTRRRAAQALIGTLTRRQLQVLELMTTGLRNKQIAGQLGIKEATVKLHRSLLLGNLRSPTSSDAIRIAVEAGLTEGQGGRT